jgi:nucleotide sugar dehydrogenase
MTKVINVVGLGYVGLPAALRLANVGYSVIGTDVNSSVVSELREGTKQFDEQGMKEELTKALSQGIKFSTSLAATNFYIIAVPTNFVKVTKKIDPQHLISAVTSILNVCDDESIIVIESTISPGTIEKHLIPLIKEKKVTFAHAPERIIPGNTLHELTTNSRIIGADDSFTRDTVTKVYKSICSGEMLTTNIKTAEITKVVENTFRDVNIAFANELKKLCQLMNIDVSEVISLANHHPRVKILNPGSGVGGHCISVDPWFLVGDYPETTKLIRAAREVNSSIPQYEWDKLKEKYNGERMGVYGLSYKPNIGDVRESPGLQLYETLSETEKSQTLFFDPYIENQIIPTQLNNFSEFLSSIDALLIMTNHDHLHENLNLIQEAEVTLFDPFYCIDEAIKI